MTMSKAKSLIDRINNVPVVHESVYPDDVKRYPDRYKEIFSKDIKVGDASINVLGSVNISSMALKGETPLGRPIFAWYVTSTAYGSKKNHGTQNGSILATGEEDTFEAAKKEVMKYKV